ncbi:2-keto-4-pentenoate hydratase/2-oxohepta-3-ene-1,7-dioic acid hydratase [Acidovorax sp. CF316]|uniref:fumarylacetoacetate hydrolase family protein n=1 Tax=Acidovorax sp. CF316 TaxID=1144317 RepID=UPI00026BD055|nr:fumarylacetoacetate hydrolase family protein [Acidovorax sp. CF316]EJE49515.1 2-keto-4-pentenoate hydratase/2-oxohepta-3-ene-1,7-dioic acid hydratase [Acidovorax sp. CF316]
MNWFGIATYMAGTGSTAPRMGLVVDNAVYDAQTAVQAVTPAAPPMPAELGALLAGWDASAATLQSLESAALAIREGRIQPPRQEGALSVPYAPARIFATASNYYEHAAEMGTQLAARSESSPYIFMKAETSVTPTKTAVVMPASTMKLDWEVELAVVIGRGGRNIALQDAYAHIAGYTVINDVSARDLTRRTDYPFSHDWFRGKSFDTFAPLGPWFVPRDCVGDPMDLRMQLTVNGESMQDASTKGMIFNIAEQIAYLSSILTLKPGDLIATGTPTGVGMGRGLFLKPGDVMVASIAQIGAIENHVTAAS